MPSFLPPLQASQLALTCLLIGSLALAPLSGCDSIADANPDGPLGGANANTAERGDGVPSPHVVVKHFDVDLTVSGALVPGAPVTISASAQSVLASPSGTFEVRAPELVALRQVGWTHSGGTVRIPSRTPIPRLATQAWTPSNGSSIQEQLQVTFPEPGYYQVTVVATAEGAPALVDGRPRRRLPI